MPRNITVTLANGQTHTYANAPDNITPEAVTARAQKEFGQSVTAIDGGRGKVAPTIAPNKAASVYSTYRNALAKRAASLGPEMQQRALDKFDTDPRMQKLRAAAGLAPVMTRRQAVQETARRVVKGENLTGLRKLSGVMLSGANDALYGLPARAAAALSGTDNDLMQATVDEMGNQSPIGQLASTLGIGLLTGGAEVKGLQAAGRGMSAMKSPIVRTVGKGVNWLSRLDKGKTAQNATRIVGMGAGQGAAAAAAKGEDVGEGAASGALATAALGTGATALKKWAVEPAMNFLRLPSSQAILRKFTNTTGEQAQKLAAAWKARTGADPTIFEILPAEDREALKKALTRMPAASREKAANLVRQRGAELGPDIAAEVGRVTAPKKQAITQTLAQDLAGSKGSAPPSPEDISLAQGAVRAPLDMKALAKKEAGNIMAPHDATIVSDKVSGLFPQHPEKLKNGTIVMVEDDPEVSILIKSAAGIRLHGKDISVKDVSSMISKIGKGVYAGRLDPGTAERATAHLLDMLPEDARAARELMSDTFAGRKKTMTGMEEGARSRTRENAGSSLEAKHAYDTPEGSTGRTLGQISALENNFLASPGTSLRNADEMASNPTLQTAVSRNLGGDEGQRIAEAAQAHAESARRLSGLNREQPAEQGAGLESLAKALLALTPGAMLGTRFRGLHGVSQFFRGIPEGRANEIVDALFSRNPTSVVKAIKMLNDSGDLGREALAKLSAALVAGGQGANIGEYLNTPTEGEPIEPSADAAPQSDEETPAEDAQPGDAGEDSPYAQDLQNIYDSESPELLDLIDRVEQQESGGDQSAVSGAGAVGVMQVMPDTAPEAAQLAGLPWDENAYRTDATYNRLLGIAYLSELLQQYEGDVEKALAAYNAGPGRVNEAISSSGGDWLAALPPETQDYVARIS